MFSSFFQRYFVLEVGILRYSKNQQDVSKHYILKLHFSNISENTSTYIH